MVTNTSCMLFSSFKLTVRLFQPYVTILEASRFSDQVSTAPGLVGVCLLGFHQIRHLNPFKLKMYLLIWDFLGS